MKYFGAGAAIFALGVVAALLAYFLLPPSLLEFGFKLAPAIAILVPTIFIALILAGLGVWTRRIKAQIDTALGAQSAELEEQRRQFIRRLDHELKNPITAIQIQLDNLQSDPGANQEAVAGVRAQVDRLAQLTRGLRRLADLETRPLELESLEVKELLGEVVALVRAPERVELDIQQRPWEPPPILGDRELLLLAFRNLVENGLNYSEGTVELRASQASNYLQVEIIDTGRGIPEADLPHVREELYRASNVQAVPGSGLGLALADGIIARHGGTLEIRSRPDEGTIATVQLSYAGG